LSIHTDVDPAVLDGLAWPNLSGEFADDPTPRSLMADLGFGFETDDDEMLEPSDELVDELCDIWETRASEVFNDALHELAARVVAEGPTL
jgi:hypothetical protein